MVSQSSILFLLAFSAVAVSARPLGRRAPMDSPGQTDQTTDKTQADLKILNEVLACTGDKMKALNVPLATADEPGQSPLPWVDAFQSCMDMFYPKSGQAQDPAASAQVGPNGNTSTGQVGTDGNTSTGQVGTDGNTSTGQVGTDGNTSTGQVGTDGNTSTGQVGTDGNTSNGQVGTDGYTSTGQVGTDGNTSTGQVGTDGNTSTGQVGTDGNTSTGQVGTDGNTSTGKGAN